MGRRPVVLEEDETLVLEVRRYPVLYDKSHPQFKDRRVSKNAWHSVEEMLIPVLNSSSVHMRKKCNQARPVKRASLLPARLSCSCY